MENIGCVIYTETSYGLEAEWILSNDNKIERGTGIGKRISLNKMKNFEGEYEITYLDTNGVESPKLKLIISCESDYYKLSWIYNEKITDMGIGIKNDNKLSAGWFKVK